MGYCVLNGLNSQLVRGLMIQKLPPISKPLMRAEIEEIDGRDGDIVTKLGYSAYDKEMVIGLYGDFDIDAVIAYFDSEGTVTFSNEPDKYYRYQIFEQIDFERLIRFRTATVKFHVQPYKYSEVGRVFTFQTPNPTPRTFNQTKNGVTARVVNGAITLSGTATDFTEFYIPIEYLNVEAGSYKMTVTATGRSAMSVGVRLCMNGATDELSFGGKAALPRINAPDELTAALQTETSYNYFYVCVGKNYAVDCSLGFTVVRTRDLTFQLRNRGNTVSQPKLTVYGVGNIVVMLNGNNLFSIALGNEGYIVIDPVDLSARNGAGLKNRLVSGDYDNLRLPVGKNVISWTGDVTRIDVEDYSRWK